MFADIFIATDTIIPEVQTSPALTFLPVINLIIILYLIVLFSVVSYKIIKYIKNKEQVDSEILCLLKELRNKK